MKTVIHNGMQHPLLHGMRGGPRGESASSGSAGGIGHALFAAVLARAVQAAQAAAGIQGYRSSQATRSQQPTPPSSEEERTMGTDGTAGAAAWTSMGLVEAPVDAGGREPLTSLEERGRGAAALAGGSGSAAPMAAAMQESGPLQRTGYPVGAGHGGGVTPGATVAEDPLGVPPQPDTALSAEPGSTVPASAPGNGPGQPAALLQTASPYPLGIAPAGERPQAPGKSAAGAPSKGGPAEVVPVTTPRGPAVAVTLGRGSLRAASRRGAVNPAVARLEQQSGAASVPKAGVLQRGVSRSATAATNSRGAAAMDAEAWEALDETSPAGRLAGGDALASGRLVSGANPETAAARGQSGDGLAGAVRTGHDGQAEHPSGAGSDAAAAHGAFAEAGVGGSAVGTGAGMASAVEGEAAGSPFTQGAAAAGDSEVIPWTRGYAAGTDLSSEGDPTDMPVGPSGSPGSLEGDLQMVPAEANEVSSRNGQRAGGVHPGEAGDGPAGLTPGSDGPSGTAQGAAEASRGLNVPSSLLSTAFAGNAERGEPATVGTHGAASPAGDLEAGDTGVRMAADIVRLTAPVRTGGAQEALLQLHPEELGRLVVRVSVENEQVQLQMRAQDASVKALLESQLPLLRHALGEQGLRLEHVRIDVTPASEGGAPGSFDGDRGAEGAATHGFGGHGHDAGRGSAPQGSAPLAMGETAAGPGDEGVEETTRRTGRGPHRIDVRA